LKDLISVRSSLFALALCSLGVAHNTNSDPRLLHVRAVFVSGNNQAAERARELLQEGGTCLSLATKASAADATMDLAEESHSQGGQFGSMGARNSVVSATVTLASGDLVWSKSERGIDAPFKSGSKAAGAVLVKRLAKDAGCQHSH